MDQAALRRTPWQRVHDKFGVSQSEFARIIGCHRSKISRHLTEGAGLINGRDQERIIAAAKKVGVAIVPADLTPGE